MQIKQEKGIVDVVVVVAEERVVIIYLLIIEIKLMNIISLVGDGDDNAYSNNHKDDDAQDIWDDVDSSNSKTFDLADFSAATFKFSETAIKLHEGTELYSKEGDDTMASLMKDDREKPAPPLELEVQEEESTPTIQKTGNEKGRSLLLQVCYFYFIFHHY